MRNPIYTVKVLIPDMGSYTTTATETAHETMVENALWDVNSARRHDGLPELSLADFQAHCRTGAVRFIVKILCGLVRGKV